MSVKQQYVLIDGVWVATGGPPGGTGPAGPAIGGVLTTKGDLVACDATTAVRVPVGAQKGMVLAVDAAAAAGVAWAAPVTAVTLLADLPTYTTVPLGARIHVTGGLGVQIMLRGPTGWVVAPESDTGWQTATSINGWGGNLQLRRTGYEVLIRGTGVDATAATADGIYTLSAAGWNSDLTAAAILWAANHGAGAYVLDIYMWLGSTTTVNMRRTLIGAYKICNFSWRHTTATAWPTTPPT